MASPYNPLAAAKAFQKQMAAVVAKFKAAAAPPPTTPRLEQRADGSVWTREGKQVSK